MEEIRHDNRSLAVAALVSGPTPIQAEKTEIDNLFLSDIFDVKHPNDKQSIVDSKTLPRKIKECMKAMKNKDVSAAGKIKVSDFICNKLANIYRLPFDKRNIIIEELGNVIYERKIPIHKLTMNTGTLINFIYIYKSLFFITYNFRVVENEYLFGNWFFYMNHMILLLFLNNRINSK